MNRIPPQIQPVDLQELGSITMMYGEIDDAAMRYINPSIAWHQGKLKIAIRSCNFKVNYRGGWGFRDGSAYSKTDVLYGDVNPETLEVRNVTKLTLSENSPTRVLVAGLEDVRLYSRKDGMYAIGFESDRLTRHLHNESTSMAEYLIKDNELKYIRTLSKPDKRVVEKNWSPTDTPSKLFDFTYSDTQVYKDGKLIGVPSKTQIHGGSQLLKQKDGTYLSLVHEKKLDTTLVNPYSRLNNRIYDKYTYYTYLAKHGENGIITNLSKPFRFGTLENIEFAAGMVEHKDDLIISLGIRDCKYALVKIQKHKLLSLLEHNGV
jgi:predicted GH43/DUF377 family glycosyl hydrolase